MQRIGRQARPRSRSLAAGVGALLGTASLVLAATSAPTSASSRPASSSVSITYANLPTSNPNYIFPFMSLAYYSVSNSQYLQNLMYRPVYWFGNGTSPAIDYRFSLAKPPLYSNGNRTVTVDLDPEYTWSDGEKVTAQDIEFFLNMYKTDPGAYAAYVPGTVPDDIASTDVTSPTQLVLHLTGSVNSDWFTYNMLSELYAFPMDWDVTSLSQPAGAEACAKATFSQVVVSHKAGSQTWTPVSAAAKSCFNVYVFLSEQSGYNPTNSAKSTNAFNTYVSSKIWSTVDGPWKLQSFSSTGNDVFVPNPSYTGPVKPSYGQLVLQNWTSDQTEVNSLFAGQTDIGYLNTQNTTSPAISPTQPGANNPRLAGQYKIFDEPLWAFAYALYNFGSTDDSGQAGKIISQLYFRQAMQDLVDQPAYIKAIWKGYGVPTYGPVPVQPANPFVTSYETNNPYPYNPAKAKQLLQSHGWSIVPNGTDVCQDAAKCGVPKGTKLALSMSWATGQQSFQELVTAEQSSWATVGINITLKPGTFTEVAGEAVPTNHHWDLADYGEWVYSPDYYPSGELLFQTGAGSNAGAYSDPKADSLIKATNFSPNRAVFGQYENYIAEQLPYEWTPLAIGVGELSNKISGFVYNPLDSLLPELWHKS
jgi:peptide/nickel transport system substrate-binding protein